MCLPLLCLALASATVVAAQEAPAPAAVETPSASTAIDSPPPDPSRGAGTQRPLYTISRSEELSLDIDGRLDEAAWQDALELSLDYEFTPGDGVRPPVATKVLLLYDSRQLYIAFRAEDHDPASIRAHLMDRDEISTLNQDDHVVVSIDTFDSQRRAFQFRVNPYGVQADAIFNQIENSRDFSWDIIWSSAGVVDGQGWSVEIALPFNQLRFPRNDGAPQTWGFDFQRSYPRNVRHRIAATVRDRDNACVLCQTSRITGFEDIESGLNLEIAPTLTADRTDRALLPGGSLESGDEDVEGGLTLRYSPTPSLTLNATVNPDFSQVEADAAQLEVNQRFALFFPEQRPFFLEGSDFFSTQIPVVFTRTVVDPEWGLKLTGKVGPNVFGFFTAQDEVNNLILPSTNVSRFASIEEDVLTTVARWRRDIGDSSTLGLLYSGREGDGDYRNRVAGIDGFFRFDGRNSLSVQAVFTDTRYPEAFAQAFAQPQGDFGGHAAEALYVYDSEEWLGSLGYRNFGRGFRADTGFSPRANFETWRGELTRLYRTDDRWYTQLQIGGVAIHTRNQDGELNDQLLSLYGGFEGPLQSRVTGSADLRDQRAGPLLFEDQLQFSTFFEIQPSGDARFTLSVDAGDDVDFENRREAETLVVNPSAELKIGPHLNAQFDFLQQDLDVEGGRLFRARLAQSQLVYQFNVRTFLRGIFQYLDIDYAPELYLAAAPPDTKQLFSQLLFSYTVNPQTVLFLGYSETRLGFDGADLEETDRTFFLKLGYAWIR